MRQIDATADEVLAVIRTMYPAEYDRAVAELTIRKLAAENERLTAQLAAHDAQGETGYADAAAADAGAGTYQQSGPVGAGMAGAGFGAT